MLFKHTICPIILQGCTRYATGLTFFLDRGGGRYLEGTIPSEYHMCHNNYDSLCVENHFLCFISLFIDLVVPGNDTLHKLGGLHAS